MTGKFRFRHTPEYVRPYVLPGKEEAAEQFYQENPGARHLELLQRKPGWMAVLPEVEEEMRGRETG